MSNHLRLGTFLLIGGAQAWVPYSPETVADDNDIHAVGLRPHHAVGQSADDPLLFRHRYQHHDLQTNRLLYYEYEAKRHAHVVLDACHKRCHMPAPLHHPVHI